MTICHNKAMPHRPRPARPRPDESQHPAPTERRYRVARYGKSRNFAAYDRENLIAVTLYRKGAEEVTARLTEQDRHIADLESRLAALGQSPVPPSLPSNEPEQAPAWKPPEQLALIAAEDMPTYRTTTPLRRLAHAPPRS
jgi:hypothetical protein